jgi:hypothetical protein
LRQQQHVVGGRIAQQQQQQRRRRSHHALGHDPLAVARLDDDGLGGVLSMFHLRRRRVGHQVERRRRRRRVPAPAEVLRGRQPPRVAVGADEVVPGELKVFLGHVGLRGAG